MSHKINAMKKLLILTILMTTFFGCSEDDDLNTFEINIRLSNVSEFKFQNVIVNTSTGNIDFGNINSRQITEYKTFELAYRYALVELEIDGEIYTLQPIDYFGETPLENGSYTYEIDANDSQEQYEKLTLTLIEE